MSAEDPGEFPDGGAATPGRTVRRDTAIMAAGTATSRALGLVRNAMLVAAIGVNASAANAFDVAQRIPHVLFAILASGVLNAVLVPQIVRAFARQGGKRTVDRILTLGGIMMLAVTLLFTAGAALLVSAFTSDWGPELTALTVAFSLWCIPQLFFYGLYALLGQVLNARSQFGPYMWAPVVNNIIAIAGLGAFLAIFGPYAGGPAEADAAGLGEPWSPGKIALLAGVATLGIAAQGLILIWPLIRGGYRWHWRWFGPPGELAGVRRVAGWALGAVLVEQVGVAWVSRVASAAAALGNNAPDVPGNAAYTNALLLYLVPHSLVTVSIATALFTGMSRYAAANDMAGLRTEISRGLRSIAIFTIFASVALIALAPLAVRVALPSAHGPVVSTVAQVLVAMSLGLVPLGAMVLVKLVYFALEDGRSLFVIHIPMTITLVGVSLIGQQVLDFHWWVAGIGLAMALSNIVAMTLRLGGLRKRLGGLDGRRIARTHLLALLAALPALGVGLLLQSFAPDLSELPTPGGVSLAAALCLGIGFAMAVTYGIGLWAFRVTEWRDALAPILRRLRIRVR